ncbi:unnamed protein product [Dimorphilus gyrociliatus]|uniref:Uncharacterized protein n=1 Tax=Dimorphilus gyrociliatus TaxID=2664684 RepID=A0A7I8WEF3_9ANNE|nr:unnamed protein product [Dimorphilus gyrociliatus]
MGNGILGEGFGMICNGLKASLESLQTIKFNNLTVPTVENENIDLNSLVKDCISLKEIYLPQNVKHYLIIDHLKSSSSKSLEFIDVFKCELNEEQGNSLADLPEECKSLREFSFAHDYQLYKAFEKICQGLLSSSHCLLNITLHNCCLNGDQTKNFSILLKECKLLQQITINSHEKYFIKEFKSIFQGLQTSKNQLTSIIIESLDIDNAPDLDFLLKY